MRWRPARKVRAVATENTERSQDRIVWIDCEMTGLDLRRDALIEVAALVTDSELTVLGDGIDVVRTMHTTSGLLDELAGGMTMAEAEAAVLGYIKQWAPEARRAPLVPARVLPGAGQARQPPGARRHPGEHRGAALLPRGRLRALPRPGQRGRPRDRAQARRVADRPDR